MSPTPSSSSSNRDMSRDRSESRLVKHQHSHSFSESGRSSVPMWDSSDPDRAPPPLPLNPAIGSSPVSKPYVSSNIEKAAALIAARALESAPSSYTSNPPPSSPDKPTMKPHHRRMQTLQDGGIGRLSDSLERRSPEKSLRASRLAQFEDYRAGRSSERSPNRERLETPTPTSRNLKLDCDENTPPSFGILALQTTRNRPETDSPLADITNGSIKNAQSITFDSLSTQILNVTNIATNLQREMSSLTKRSKDNASDLMSLREATNTRDEDIRKSLRDLLSGLDQKFGKIDSRLLGAPENSRSTPNLPLFLEDGEQASPSRKGFTLPRIASPAFFDRDITASPSVVSVDGAASIAMLEKVLREMATKDGQDKLMTSLELVKAQAETPSPKAVQANVKPNIDPKMMQKLEEILVFMRDMKADSGSRALVKAAGPDSARSISQMDLYLDTDHKINNQKSGSTDSMNEEVSKTLRNVKQSLSQQGGLTNEVKALVRELRGEVLGMGREIARKLDQVNSSSKGLEVASQAPDQGAVVQVVDQGLAELKEHIHQIAQENSRLLLEQMPVVSTGEIVEAVEHALAAMPQVQTEAPRNVDAEREELISAVREAWEECKPEIALEHFGLERDEILETLKKGLQSYQPQNMPEQAAGATYEQILEAIREGLNEFQIPQPQMQHNNSKEDVVLAVRECLETFNFPVPQIAPTDSGISDMSKSIVTEAVREVFASHTQANHLTKGEILETVRDGLTVSNPAISKEIEFNREDLFDAIKACLEGDQNPLGGMGERVVEAMHEFLSSMKTEFQQYSAANGRDTEQVLDAIKDGLEDLRAEIENYVDRASDVTGKDEIVDVVKHGFAAMQADMDKGFAARSQQSMNTPELLDAMEKEFEHLRETMRRALSSSDISATKHEILDAIRDISDDRQSSVSGSNEDVARLVKDELEHMRTTLASTLIKSSTSLDRDEVLETIREGLENHRTIPRAEGNESILSNTSELLDAFQDGVENIRADMQKLLNKPVEMQGSEDILDTLRDGIESIRNDIDHVRMKINSDDGQAVTRGQEVMLHDENAITTQLEALKVMITQLRIKVEALDIPLPEPMPNEMRVHQEDLDSIHSLLRQNNHKDDLANIYASIREMKLAVTDLPREAPQVRIPEVVMPANAVCKEDTDAIETLLHNMKAKIDSIALNDFGDNVKTTHVENLEALLRDIKSSVSAASDSAHKEDFTLIELTLKDISNNIELLFSKVENGSSGSETSLSKTDLEVLESICLDIKTRIDDTTNPELENLAAKEDLTEIRDTIKAFKEQFESDNDLTAQAFEARKIEHGGLATKIDDVKSVIAQIKEEMMSKLDGSLEGITDLSKVLGMHHDNMDQYATATSLSELTDLVTKAFDSHHSNKAEMEERDQTLFLKHEEVSTELKESLEEKFVELMTKYDDAQISNEKKLGMMEERDKAHMESAGIVKDVVSELKTLMDTLGSTVAETCEKMTSDSRTVFDVVDQSNIKLAEINATNSHEHSLTREEIAKTLDATHRLEGALHDSQPAVLAAIREVLEKVNVHFEQSQQHSEKFNKATEEIKTRVAAIPEAIPPLLPALPAADTAASVFADPVVEKYDDAHINAKLDELLAHSAMAKEAFASMDNHHTNAQESLSLLQKLEQLQKLEGIDGKLSTVTSEISAMVATQTRLMAEHHDKQAAEAREAAIALEKRTAQKENVEADIIRLTQEKNALVESMAALRREHEQLNMQTKRLNRDVAKLETALSIRHEEMREMNNRAEGLEKRILEGVMNHARSIKITTKPLSKKKVTPAERDASMNLKRVPSTASNATARASVKAPSNFGTTLGMALKKRNSPATTPNNNGTTRMSAVDRRIMSTSHVNSGRLSDVNHAMVLAPSRPSGLINLKRSQSVKSNPSTYISGRKPSWTGMESTLADKENRDMDHDNDSDSQDDDSSDGGTERRTSFSGTSYMYTDSRASRSSRRSTSYASSIQNTIDGHGPQSIAEEDEDEESDLFEESMIGDEPQMNKSHAIILAQSKSEDSPGDFVHVDAEDDDAFEEADTIAELPTHSEVYQHESKFVGGSDSGIGTELPTPI